MLARSILTDTDKYCASSPWLRADSNLDLDIVRCDVVCITAMFVQLHVVASLPTGMPGMLWRRAPSCALLNQLAIVVCPDTATILFTRTTITTGQAQVDQCHFWAALSRVADCLLGDPPTITGKLKMLKPILKDMKAALTKDVAVIIDLRGSKGRIRRPCENHQADGSVTRVMHAMSTTL